jgi:hypothetical protein
MFINSITFQSHIAYWLFGCLFTCLFIRCEQVKSSSLRASNPWLELEKAAFVRGGHSSDQFLLADQAKNRLSSDPPLSKAGRRAVPKLLEKLGIDPDQLRLRCSRSRVQLPVASTDSQKQGNCFRYSRHSWSCSTSPTPAPMTFSRPFVMGFHAERRNCFYWHSRF